MDALTERNQSVVISVVSLREGIRAITQAHYYDTNAYYCYCCMNVAEGIMHRWSHTYVAGEIRIAGFSYTEILELLRITIVAMCKGCRNNSYYWCSFTRLVENMY